jgi:hypothetical protein
MARAAMKMAVPPIAVTTVAAAPLSPRCSGASEWLRCFGTAVLLVDLATLGLATGLGL